MKNLIARLEAATEGSRELDAEIAKMVGTFRSERSKDEYHGTHFGPDYSPPYTTSIDTALTLMSEGWFWDIQNEPEFGGYCRMTDVPDIGEKMKDIVGYASTPALATCSAALKAREAAK